MRVGADAKTGFVSLRVIKASDLAKADFGPGKKSDPYVVAYIGEKNVLKTRPVTQSLDPHFEDDIHASWDGFGVKAEDPLVLQVWDYDKITKHDFLGEVRFKSFRDPQLLEGTHEYKLVPNPKNKSRIKVKGTVTLFVRWQNENQNQNQMAVDADIDLRTDFQVRLNELESTILSLQDDAHSHSSEDRSHKTFSSHHSMEVDDELDHPLFAGREVGGTVDPRRPERGPITSRKTVSKQRKPNERLVAVSADGSEVKVAKTTFEKVTAKRAQPISDTKSAASTRPSSASVSKRTNGSNLKQRPTSAQPNTSRSQPVRWNSSTKRNSFAKKAEECTPVIPREASPTHKRYKLTKVAGTSKARPSSAPRWRNTSSSNNTSPPRLRPAWGAHNPSPQEKSRCQSKSPVRGRSGSPRGSPRSHQTQIVELPAEGATPEFLTTLFNRYDRNQSGNISRGELKTLLMDCGELFGLRGSSEDAEGFMRAIDYDDSGAISLDEFLEGAALAVKLNAATQSQIQSKLDKGSFDKRKSRQEKREKKEKKEKQKAPKNDIAEMEAPRREEMQHSTYVDEDHEPVKRTINLMDAVRLGSPALEPTKPGENDVVNLANHWGVTALHRACHMGDLSTVTYLIKRGAVVNATNQLGGTPLHYACAKGYVDVASFLLQLNGVELDCADLAGNTPLHLAAKKGQMEMVKFLVKRGASVAVTNNDGESPIAVANSHDIRALMRKEQAGAGQNPVPMQEDEFEDSSAFDLRDRLRKALGERDKLHSQLESERHAHQKEVKALNKEKRKWTAERTQLQKQIAELERQVIDKHEQLQRQGGGAANRGGADQFKSSQQEKKRLMERVANLERDKELMSQQLQTAIKANAEANAEKNKAMEKLATMMEKKNSSTGRQHTLRR